MTLNGKSVDAVLGTQTRGGSMVDADESTVLWRHPYHQSFWSGNDRQNVNRTKVLEPAVVPASPYGANKAKRNKIFSTFFSSFLFFLFLTEKENSERAEE